jgi:hypothetical protein
MKQIIGCFLIIVCSMTGIAQSQTTDVFLEPISIDGFGGIQSFAWGSYEDKILIAGGRLDGLHRRQPFAAFDEAGHNTSLIVIEPGTQSVWSRSVAELPVAISEQLSSTNMEFEQAGETLYMVGGYGYSATDADHITHDKLTAVDVPGLINAIISDAPIAEYFRQISGETFRVTGGHLNKIGDLYYLSGGQNFEGRYNPQGPDFGPGFIQEYTNSIRRFSIVDDGINLDVVVLEEWLDEENLHRRDYNVVDQIMPDGTSGFTAFSGVFRTDADLPYLNCVNVGADGYEVNNSFAQYYNHYHCATLPFHSALSNEMCTIFFGGIAQYYDDNGILTQDDNVPFVNTIGMVCRNASGEMTEYKLQCEMPGLLGAGSEFVPVENAPQYNNGVIDYDALEGDSILVGYVIGGISSSASNIFFTNNGTQSEAVSTIYKVYLLKNSITHAPVVNAESRNELQLLIYPNPTGGEFQICYHTIKSGPVEIEIRESTGKIIHHKKIGYQKQGEHVYKPGFEEYLPDGSYLVTVRHQGRRATQRIILTH